MNTDGTEETEFPNYFGKYADLVDSLPENSQFFSLDNIPKSRMEMVGVSLTHPNPSIGFSMWIFGGKFGVDTDLTNERLFRFIIVRVLY